MSGTMTPVNYRNWGNLNKTWATGENRLEDGNEYPVPKTGMPVADLQQQLRTALTGIEVPPDIQKIEVVHDEPGKLVIRIPSREQIVEAEKRLARAEYVLPHFYRDAFDHAEQTPLPDATARLIFHAQRIGDYTISNCQ